MAVAQIIRTQSWDRCGDQTFICDFAALSLRLSRMKAAISLLLLVFAICTARKVEEDRWYAGSDLNLPFVFPEDIETHCYDFRVDLTFFTKRILQLGQEMLDDNDIPALRTTITAVNESALICHSIEEFWKTIDQITRSSRYFSHARYWKNSHTAELRSLFRITNDLCTLLTNTTVVNKYQETSVMLKLFSPHVADEMDLLSNELSHHGIENTVFTVRTCRNMTVGKYRDQLFYPIYRVSENPFPGLISLPKELDGSYHLTLRVEVHNGTAHWTFQQCMENSTVHYQLFKCVPLSERRPFESLRLKTYIPGIKDGPEHREAEFYAQLDANNTVVLADNFWAEPERMRAALRDLQTDTHSESLLQLIKRGFLSVVEVADNSTHAATPAPLAIVTAATPANASTSHLELKTAENVGFSVDWTLLSVSFLFVVSLLLNISLILRRRSTTVPKTAESAQIIGSFANEFFEEP